MCGHLSCILFRGPGPKPRHVPWLGIEPVTLWFAGQHSIHWATPGRAHLSSFYASSQFTKLFSHWLAHLVLMRDKLDHHNQWMLSINSETKKKLNLLAFGFPPHLLSGHPNHSIHFRLFQLCSEKTTGWYALGPRCRWSRNALAATWNPNSLEIIWLKVALSNKNVCRAMYVILNFLLGTFKKKIQTKTGWNNFSNPFYLLGHFQNIIISMGNQDKMHINKIFSFVFFSHKMIKTRRAFYTDSTPPSGLATF